MNSVRSCPKVILSGLRRVAGHEIVKLFCLAYVTVNITIAQSPKKFFYGVNGHPLTQESYQGNINLQVRLINDLNSKFYRIDIPISNGKISDENRFSTLMVNLQKHGVRVLPVLVFDKSVYLSIHQDSIYDAGKKYGKTFIERYGKHFKYYEVGNEEGTNVILGAHVDGNVREHYNIEKVKLLMRYLKGICDAIKIESPSAKIIINETWVHYGFFEFLKQYKIKYDIIGYHWYSDMGDINNAAKGFGSVLDTLKKKYNKRIWVTEINYRGGINTTDLSSKNNWLLKNLRAARSNKYTDALFIYELLDQPAFDNPQSPYRNPSEAYYGLYEWQDRYKTVVQKSVRTLYRNFIKRNP